MHYLFFLFNATKLLVTCNQSSCVYIVRRRSTGVLSSALPSYWKFYDNLLVVTNCNFYLWIRYEFASSHSLSRFSILSWIHTKDKSSKDVDFGEKAFIASAPCHRYGAKTNFSSSLKSFFIDVLPLVCSVFEGENFRGYFIYFFLRCCSSDTKVSSTEDHLYPKDSFLWNKSGFMKSNRWIHLMFPVKEDIYLCPVNETVRQCDRYCYLNLNTMV